MRSPPEHAAPSVRQLVHLSERLLARADAKACPVMDRARIGPAQVVCDSAGPFLDRAIAKHIDIGFEAEPAPMFGSPWVIREMADNLIDKAIKYTADGGRITVRSAVRDRRAVLEVEDDGPGIPPAERERVFERFHRGAGAYGQGCGLGLAIVREIADAHGAAVSIADPPGGKGTLVRVTFALAASPA